MVVDGVGFGIWKLLLGCRSVKRPDTPRAGPQPITQKGMESSNLFVLSQCE